MAASTQERTVSALTAQDRCDRCSARAAVVTVMFGGSSLLWCGHHYDQFSDALAANGANIAEDQRAR